ncbi:hypothetical protein ONZ45_g16229 [Pleurotus djamor]|nr:hypothetical protein ONZ45_g16229 [Pleurotus djamor]
MEFTFDNRDLLNSDVRYKEDNLVYYSVATEEVNDKTRTVIRHGGEIEATIHWEDRFFETEGRKLSFRTVKRRLSGFWTSSSSRVWRWDGAAYVVQYDDGKWEAKSELEDVLGSTLTPYRDRFFHDDEPASFVVKTHAYEDLWFFLMVFVYSEFKRIRKDAEKTATIKAVAKTATLVLEAQKK